MLPEGFILRMQSLLGEEYAAFSASFDRPLCTGLRLNPLKTGFTGDLSRFSLSPVPWCPTGYVYDAASRPGLSSYHAAGLYYLQEPSAMAPAELTQVCRQTGAALPEGKLLLFGQVAYLVPQELPEIKGLRVLRAGLELGQTMKNRFEPAHAWALWLKGLENSVSLAADAPELGQYLSGNVLPSGLCGWTLVRVDGLSLGWAKGDGTQLKNHYPKALRRPV